VLRPLEALVAAGEHVAQLGVGRFDGLHGGIDRRAEVVTLGQVDEARQAGAVGHVQHRAGPVVVGSHRVAGRCLRFQLRADRLEAMLGVGEEDQTEHRPPVSRPA
jgi:hypothetical protein